MGLTFNLLILSVGAKFLTLGVGAREIAFGSVGSVFVRDANATYFNPSLLSFQDMGSFVVSHTNYLLDMRMESFSLSNPFGKVFLGINFYGFFVNELEGRTGPSESFTPFGASFLNTNFSVSGFLYKNFSVGLTLKNVYERIDTFSSSSFAFDLGFVYKPEVSFFELGGVLSNIGGKLKLKSENYELPASLRIGLGFHYRDFKCGIEFFRILKENTEFHIGFEYLLKNILFIRSGYVTGYKETYNLAGFKFGLGLKYTPFNLDYTSEPYGDFGNVHRLSLGVSFKPLRFKFPERKKIPLEPKPEKPILKEIKPKYPFNLDSLYEVAIKEYENKNYAKSYILLMEVVYVDRNFKNSFEVFSKVKETLTNSKIDLVLSDLKKNLEMENYLDAYSLVKSSYDLLNRPETLGKKLSELELLITEKFKVKGYEKDILIKAFEFYKEKRYRDAITELKKLPENDLILKVIKICEEKRERKIKSNERDLEFYIRNEFYEKAYSAISDIEIEGFLSSELIVMKTRVEGKLKEKAKTFYEEALSMEKNKKFIEALLLVGKSIKIFPLEESKKLEKRLLDLIQTDNKLYEELMIFTIKLFHQGKTEDALILWGEVEKVNPSDERLSYIKFYRIF
ncbi:MAG: PorV/PorQ family protein [Candidatus Hydrothermales bacterium]